ncbi:FAD:protein FMN transferase [Leifsonia sp. L25]|uniref:FAD:protein FMN transferase n=1 Tax=Actinomycetes TaxID=1760 RepID=UPI003D680B5A
MAARDPRRGHPDAARRPPARPRRDREGARRGSHRTPHRGETGADALVSLGGDIATAGATERLWEVLVQDLPSDPAQQIAIPNGAGVATSSTQKRRWRSDGQARHHILDPRFGLPADDVWRSVTVAAATCVRANALSTASIVRGLRAPGWLRGLGADARLVARDGSIVTTGRWPEDLPSTGTGANRWMRCPDG